MPQRFVVLDSWRGIAACLVALFHLNAYSHLYDVPFLRNAWLFVDFFFVLSGFIIAANYEERLRAGYGIGQFLLLRLGRLYPLHLLMLALFIAFELLKLLARGLLPEFVSPNSIAPFSTAEEAPGTILANLLLIQSLHLYDFLTWNWPSWSISTEFYTYVVFAACWSVLRNHMRIVLALAMIGGPVLIAVLGEGDMNTTYDWGIIRCIYGFAAGVITWHLYRKGGSIVKWLSGSMAEWILVGAVVIFVSVAGTGQASVAAPYVFSLVVLVFASEAGTASAILGRRPLLFLGAVSYSIYLTHVFIAGRLFDAASAFNKLWHIDPFTHRDIFGEDRYFLGTQLWQGDLAYLAYLGMVIATSYFTYNWIEKPARERVRNWVQRRRQARLGEMNVRVRRTV